MSSRPYILWGIDDCAGTILDPFIDIFKSRTSDAKIYRISGSNQQDQLEAFKENLSDLKESLQSQHTTSYPKIIVCSSAFDPESERNLEHLKEISNTLGKILSRDQSISFVVFFPPPVADPQEKVQTFKYFIRLEDLVWRIPFLNIIFINQLSKRLYLFSKKLNDEHAGIEDKHEEAMYEFLYRELMDDAFDHTIQGVGFNAIRNRNKVADRKCCYSTLGAYKLIYEPQVCMRYLEARFQYELFNSIFMNEEAIEKNQKHLAFIQEHVDQFTKGQIETLESHLPKLIKDLGNTFESYLTQNYLGGESKRVQLLYLENIRNDFLTDSSESGSKINQIEQLQKSIEKKVHGEFLNFLGKSPGNFAGAGFYLNALLGLRLFSFQSFQKEEQFSGTKQIEKEFCMRPLKKYLKEDFRSLLHELIEGFSQLNLTSSSSLAAYSGNTLDEFLDDPDSEVSDLDKVEDFINGIITGFINDINLISETINSNREKIKKAEEAFQNSLKEYGFFGRKLTKRKEYNNQVAKHNELIKGIEAEIAKLKEFHNNLTRMFISFMMAGVFPYTLRMIFSHTLKEEIEREKEDFDGFIRSIRTPLQEKWDEASSVKVNITPTYATILNERKLNILYENKLKGKKLVDLAEIVLEFNLSEEKNKALSYFDCRELKDYYPMKAQALGDRMRDYAYDFFSDIRTMNVLDIIEIEGKDNAYNYLKDKIEMTGTFLDFSTGFVPLVEHRGIMIVKIILRSDKIINKRLSSEYKYLFDENSEFHDNKNRDVIDVTRLIFGFPAFLIHGLCEFRDLFHAAESASNIDLWPLGLM